MRFAFTDEQEELRAALRDLLTDRAPSARVREIMQTPDGVDRELWRALAEMGIAGMLVPEEYDGLGFGFLELAVALEEAGRALLPAPLLSTAVLGVTAVLAAEDPARAAEILPGVAAGTITLTVARSAPAACTAVLRADGRWRLTGDLGTVLDGASADLVVVAATDPSGATRLFTVSSDSGARLPTMDQTVRLAHLVLDDTPATPLGGAGVAEAVLARVEQLAAVGLALLAVGGAATCLDASVEYARTRVQFGRPIGSFQAIQHRCADMLLEVESARSAAYYASWCAVADPAALPVYASVAKSYATEAYRRAAGEQIQIHGGIGFTWEHDAHLHLKRAATLEALYGSPTEHRRLLWESLATSTEAGLVEPSASR
ncbi:acyl-CoA dehydrogenase family protein [Pseudonocardia lutea]|uniref:Acyl-CoA dehydrogenase family protein n=1 Tax=Pseudonocardia lutea TaxID=2172015 RepID=A0ABW1ICU7_9PSEU